MCSHIIVMKLAWTFYFLTNKTLATAIEKTAAGFKLSKEWVTLIFALMAVVLTGKSQCPCCFHDIHHKLEYTVPKNAWMTTASSSMACSSNMVNMIQPTDQGNIKWQYKHKLLRKLVIEKEVRVSTQKQLTSEVQIWLLRHGQRFHIQLCTNIRNIWRTKIWTQAFSFLLTNKFVSFLRAQQDEPAGWCSSDDNDDCEIIQKSPASHSEEADMLIKCILWLEEQLRPQQLMYPMLCQLSSLAFKKRMTSFNRTQY